MTPSVRLHTHRAESKHERTMNMLAAQTALPKPGTVTMVSCNLDLITDPIPLKWNKFSGGSRVPVGNISGDTALCVKIPRKSIAKSGNANTATWRKVHGGGWCSPRNLKFKGGK